ncbi:MAG: peptidoglycan DD-metalloendopeptidase family protein [Syntrophaceae bacterium]|nr:peptidoglycan DD-metalloendopeptidase family protein [Syntrophaceae bacterium]
MRSWKWIAVGFFLIGWISFSNPSDLWPVGKDQIEKDLSQKKKDLKDVKKEISLTKEKKERIQKRETSVLESLHALESELYKREKELREMEVRLARTKERLQQTKNQIAILNQGIEQTREELFFRLIALYKMERVAPESFLLASQSYLDLLKLDKFLRAVINSDVRLIDTYRHQMSLKSRYQEGLVQDQLQWERNIAEVEKKKKEVQRVRRGKQALLRSIQSQKVVYQRVIEELGERARQLQALIDKLERERTLLAYGTQKSGTLKGRLIAPVQGKVISRFKEGEQNGVEIRAQIGAEIRAVLSGKVLYADWFKGFGNIVVIDHGDHTFTVSGYASELLKKEGDAVSQGEPIGLVGGAGSLKGPCLYFEIRHRGKPQDPMEWFSSLERSALFSEVKQKGKR